MKLSRFRISNYRNVIDSGWIEMTSVTAFVGQNEAGKSNLFEALHRLHPYDDADYDPDEDWPVDDWKGRKNTKGNVVSRALYAFEDDEATELFEFATVPPEGGTDGEVGAASDSRVSHDVPRHLREGIVGHGRHMRRRDNGAARTGR